MAWDLYLENGSGGWELHAIFSLQGSQLTSRGIIIGDNVEVRDGTRIGNNVKIGNNSRIRGDVTLKRKSAVGRNSTLSGRVVLGQGVKFPDNTVNPSNFTIGDSGSYARYRNRINKSIKK
jgi:UDP-3-O-[3-hydroxymyristoyl] glucosamine N-acyltransferase